MHVGASDGSGNIAAGTDVTVTVRPTQSTLTMARFQARWKRSKASGTMTVAGSAPRAGAYAIDVTKGRSTAMHISLNLPAGAFIRALKLPARLLPGIYDVSLLPSAPATQITPASLHAALAAPPEGVVDVAYLSARRRGPAARSLTGTSEIWASFHFAAKPKGKLTLTWHRLGKKRVRLRSTRMNSAARVIGSITSRTIFKGRYEALLSRKGVVISKISVKAK